MVLPSGGFPEVRLLERVVVEEDAVELDLFGLVLVLAGEAVGRVGEVEPAVGVPGEVVGAVEALAVVFVDEDAPVAGRGDLGDAAVAVFADEQIALGVEGEAVGADEGAVRELAFEDRVLEVRGLARGRVPLGDDVAGDVAK